MESGDIMAFASRSVLITGATRGIGLEFVRQLAALKNPPRAVIGCFRNIENATELIDLAKTYSYVHAVKMDVTKDKDIEEAVVTTDALVGDLGLNLLINNAGIYECKSDGGRLDVQTRDRMNKHFDVNVTSPILVSQKLLPLLRRASVQHPGTGPSLSASRSAIVMIASYLGSQTSAIDDPYRKKDHIDYRCSKTALHMAAILMSRDLTESGILVMGLHPGWVQTNIGGADALLTSKQSVEGCLKVISQADEKHVGRTTDYTGKILPF